MTEGHRSAAPSPVPWAELAGVVFDMDGVLWRGETPLPGLSNLFRCLAERDLGYVLATNNASRRPIDYVARMSAFGVSIAEDRVLTSAMAAAADLKSSHPGGANAYVIGEVGLIEAIQHAGLIVRWDAVADVAAVVVGYDRGLTYAKLRDASVLLQRGADFVATNIDASFPVEGAVHPGAGATVAALVATTERVPRVVGKPEPGLFQMAATRLRATPGRMLMVGDRLDTDVAGAIRFGMWSVLVTTGIDTAADAAASRWQPNGIVASLDELAESIRQVVAGHL